MHSMLSSALLVLFALAPCDVLGVEFEHNIMRSQVQVEVDSSAKTDRPQCPPDEAKKDGESGKCEDLAEGTTCENHYEMHASGKIFQCQVPQSDCTCGSQKCLLEYFSPGASNKCEKPGQIEVEVPKYCSSIELSNYEGKSCNNFFRPMDFSSKAKICEKTSPCVKGRRCQNVSP